MHACIGRMNPDNGYDYIEHTYIYIYIYEIRVHADECFLGDFSHMNGIYIFIYNMHIHVLFKWLIEKLRVPIGNAYIILYTIIQIIEGVW